MKDKQQLESKYGTRYSELMRLPYFNCVRFTVIDPMHNLFLGTAKNVMENVWLNHTKPLLSDAKLKLIQQRVDQVGFPSSLGRLPNKNFHQLWGIYGRSVENVNSNCVFVCLKGRASH